MFLFLLCRYEDRIIIKSPSFRSSLRKASHISKELLSSCEIDAPWLLPAMKLFADEHIPSDWVMFFKDLASSTSALALVVDPPKSIPLLRRLLTSEIDADILSGLKSFIPTLYKIIRNDVRIITCVRPIIAHILTKIDPLLEFRPHNLPPSMASTPVVSLLPNLPVLTERGVYTLDKGNRSVCSKKAPKHRTLTPGIFTVNCIHGIVYHFNLVLTAAPS